MLVEVRGLQSARYWMELASPNRLKRPARPQCAAPARPRDRIVARHRSL